MLIGNAISLPSVIRDVNIKTSISTIQDTDSKAIERMNNNTMYLYRDGRIDKSIWNAYGGDNPILYIIRKTVGRNDHTGHMETLLRLGMKSRGGTIYYFYIWEKDIFLITGETKCHKPRLKKGHTLNYKTMRNIPIQGLGDPYGAPKGCNRVYPQDYINGDHSLNTYYSRLHDHMHLRDSPCGTFKLIEYCSLKGNPIYVWLPYSVIYNIHLVWTDQKETDICLS